MKLVGVEEARTYARKVGAFYHEVSAKTGQGIEKLFDNIIANILPESMHNKGTRDLITGNMAGIVRSVHSNLMLESTYIDGARHGLSRQITKDGVFIELYKDDEKLAEIVYDNQLNLILKNTGYDLEDQQNESSLNALLEEFGREKLANTGYDSNEDEENTDESIMVSQIIIEQEHEKFNSFKSQQSEVKETCTIF